jgi:hypothetical protein
MHPMLGEIEWLYSRIVGRCPAMLMSEKVNRVTLSEGGIDPEEAKQVANCIVEALSEAGLRIVPASDS